MRQNWQQWEVGLSDSTINQIIAEAEQQPASDATIFADNEVNSDIRTSTVRWIERHWVRDILWEYVKRANVDAFGVDVLNHAEMQFTEYHADNNGHYDWHHDVSWESFKNGDRKISITVQLSDPNEYEGGEFQFNEVESPTSKYKGSVLVFPSYLQHRVLPVTKGIRRSLVAWFYGPRWK